MSARWTVVALSVSVASSGCLSGPRERPPPRAPGQRAAEICHHDEECAANFHCTSDHLCRCQFDEDCAATRACRAGLCLPR